MPDFNDMPNIAARMFGAPLMIEPNKARVIASAFGPRVFAVPGPAKDLSLGEVSEMPAKRSGSILAEGLADYLVENQVGYIVHKGVAVIEVVGSLVRRGSWLGQSSGMTSYEGLRAQLKAAAADRSVRAIALEFDSPGGEAAGAFELADLVREIRSTKPVYGFAAEMAYSAAYALASQCDVLTVPEFGGVGSIGVIMMHVEMSRKLEQDGLTVTIIRSGAHKAEGNSVEPLPEALREEWTSECDKMRVSFGELVGKGRGERFDMAAALKTEARCYTGPEAVRIGLADRVADPKKAFDAMVASVNETGRWDGTIPEKTGRITASSSGCATGAEAPFKKEGDMPDKVTQPEVKETTGTPTVAQTTPAPAATPETPKGNPDAAAIIAACGRAGLSAQFASKLIEEGKTYAAASSDIIDAVAQKNADHDGGDIANGIGVKITGDAVDRQREGMTAALLAKAGLEGGQRNEFTSMSLTEMARATLTLRGLSVTGTKRDMIGAAFVPTMAGGMHSTSDFGNILADVANKSALKGYADVDENFPLFTSVGSASDFKKTKRVGTGQFPTLDKVEEGADFSYGTMSDHGEEVVVATFGKMFAITRQAVINDDLGAFTDVPRKAGAAAKRTIAQLVYAILNGNPTMSDGTALFAAGHGNLAASGAAPSEATIDAAITAMAKQKGRGATDDAPALNIAPKYLLAPHSLRSAVLGALMSEKTPDTTGNKSSQRYNTVYKAAEPIFDSRITGSSWFLAADPSMVDTIEVTYLDGITEPFIDQQTGWNIDGTEMKVRIDAAATPLDWAGLYKNAGA